MQRFGKHISMLVALIAASFAAGCGGLNHSDVRSQSSDDQGSGPVADAAEFSPNGEAIAPYSELGEKNRILSAAFPSANPIDRLAAVADDGAGLALFSGAPLTGSMLDSMATEVVQVHGKGANDVFLTADRDGNYAVVVYVNSTIGYMFPSTGDLANCSSIIAPIGNQTLPILDCIAIGSATSIIQNYTRYTNGSYVRNGSYFYYEDGRTATDGYSFYYQDGTRLKSSSYYYWPNGATMASSSYLYYPSNASLYSSGLRYADGSSFTSGSSVYYDDGSYLKSSSGYVYYPSGSRLYDTSNYLYYPNGNYLKSSGGTIYSETGSSGLLFVGFSRAFTAANAYVNANQKSSWIGLMSSNTAASFDAKLLSQLPIGATVGTGTQNPLPPTPANLAVTDNFGTSVSVQWRSSGGTTQSYQVKALSDPKSFLPTCVGGNQTNSLSYTFTGLVPGANYAFLVCALNSDGLLSPAAIVLESAGNPVRPPVNVIAGLPSGSSISVSWQTVDSSVAGFYAVASKSPAVPTDCVSGKSIGNVNSYTFNGLEENATYYLAICAVNGYGIKSQPAIASAKTLPVPAPEATSITFASPSPSQLQVSWISGGGSTSRFLLEVAASPAVPAACTAASTAPSQASALLGKLLPDTAYAVRVCSQTANGTISPGLVREGRTLPVAVDGLDFAGAFGSINRGVNNSLNPLTNAATCPAGYVAYKFTDSPGVDYPASFCYRRPIAGTESALDFGGMLGTKDLVAQVNPAGGQLTCPIGYSEQQLLFAAGGDASLKICYRTHVAGRTPDVLFGGIFGKIAGVSVDNPATGDQSCAPGFVKSSVYGTTTATPRDYEVFMCHKALVALPPNALNLAVGAVTYQSAALSWTSGGGNSANYLLAFSEGSVAPATCDGGQVLGNVLSTIVSGLAPSKTYSFRLCATNAFLGAASGLVVSATTPAIPKASEVTQLVATSPTSTTAKLTWVSGGGTTVGFIAARATSATPPVDCSGGTVTGTATTLNVTGLLPGTTYSFRVCALNASNVSSAGVTATVTTSSLVIAINANGKAVGNYSADMKVTGGAGFSTAAAINMTGLVNPAPMAVYQTNRFGAMTYTMDGLVAGKSYVVRLHFCENYFTTAGSRKFNVTMNGTAVLSNFDIFSVTRARNKALIKEFVVTASNAGKIVIGFTNVVNNADITGLEVLVAP